MTFAELLACGAHRSQLISRWPFAVGVRFDMRYGKGRGCMAGEWSGGRVFRKARGCDHCDGFEERISLMLR